MSSSSFAIAVEATRQDSGPAFGGDVAKIASLKLEIPDSPEENIRATLIPPHLLPIFVLPRRPKPIPYQLLSPDASPELPRTFDFPKWAWR